jgi:pimeloyl-ACP methyl ester carboxylesterase
MSGDAEDYSIAREIDDIEAVLAAAGSSACLVGHSYGALCSLLTASRTPVRRLALYEPPWPIHGPAHTRCLAPCADAVRRGAYEEALMTFLSEVGLPPAGPMPPEVVALAPTLVREMQGVDSVGPGLKQFVELRTPTLLLLGALSDQPHIRDTMLELARLAPKAQLRKLEGHGHMANLFAPTLVADEIAAFFTAR